MNKANKVFRILLAEDEAVIALCLQKILEDMGHDVVAVVDTASEAVEKANLFRPDLVFMDIHLKGKSDGIEAANQIRQSVSIPIVFLTAYSDKETIKRAEMSNPFGYLRKPISEFQLKAVLEKIPA